MGWKKIRKDVNILYGICFVLILCVTAVTPSMVDGAKKLAWDNEQRIMVLEKTMKKPYEHRHKGMYGGIIKDN